jgi:hypothetical protein
MLNSLRSIPWRHTVNGSIATPFLTSALGKDEWSASRPCHFTLGDGAPGTRWVGPKASLDDVERIKILPLPGLIPVPRSPIP